MKNGDMKNGMDENKAHFINVSGLMSVPVFVGCLGSLFLCVMLFQAGYTRAGVPEVQAITLETEDEQPLVEAKIQFFARVRQTTGDSIQETYRHSEGRERVINYFTEICSSTEIAEAILANADKYDISPALALALAWEESRLNHLAVNSKNRDESIDRGLFQLNNRSFPRLDVQAFFNPDINARYGMSHLRHCLDTGGTEIAALAMYNAGTGRVRNSGTPKTTLDYVSRILENRREIESHFLQLEALYRQHEDFVEIADAGQERPRLVPLMPLKGKN